MSGETFETLLAPNVGGVRTLVRRRIRDGHAEDVLQEILLLAFRHRDQLRVPARFKTWLWSIALNEIRTYFRRDRGMMSLEEFPSLDARDPSISPLARLEQTERRDWVRACMAKLSERDQATIRLRDIEEKSLPDAAAVLEISVPATKSAHFRARKRLERILRDRARRQVRSSIRQAA
jgi:RNA polymerase sigma-70 factor (ECF subfamily)